MGVLVCPAVLTFAALMAPVERPRFHSDDEIAPTPFDLQVCVGTATHIVLTTPGGVVLESWRGDLAPGDIVRIGYLPAAPIDTIPLEFTRLRSEHPFGEWYLPGCLTLKCDRGKEPAAFDRGPGRRLLLFLRKVHDNELGDYWWPAAGSYRPAIKEYVLFSDPGSSKLVPSVLSSTSSALLVEDGVAFGLAGGDGQIHMAVVSRSLPGFRLLVESVSVKDILNSCSEGPTFDLKTCVARATDIVAVDGAGRVAEVWKGDSKPGEVIPLSHLDDPTSGDFSGWEPGGRFQGSRRILFLVRPPEVPIHRRGFYDVGYTQRIAVEYDLLGNEEIDFSPDYYIQMQTFADTSFTCGSSFGCVVFDTQPFFETRPFFTLPSSGWLPANESGGFDASMAYIDPFGMVCTKQCVQVFGSRRFGCIGPEYEYQWQPLTTEDSFRQQVFEMVESMRGECAGIEVRSNNIVASEWDFR